MSAHRTAGSRRCRRPCRDRPLTTGTGGAGYRSPRFPGPAVAPGYSAPVGSKGGKPRKPDQHHLPKVGSPENIDSEIRMKRKEAFGGWPIVLVLAILVLGFFAWIVFTAI